MAETLAEKAAVITCKACSLSTSKVHITSFDPFTVEPEDVLDTTFASQNIMGTQVDIFKRAASDLIPSNQKGRPQIQLKVRAQPIDTNKKIMRFSNFLEACFAEQEAST